jgi:hypothetical protein
LRTRRLLQRRVGRRVQYLQARQAEQTPPNPRPLA